MVAAVELGDETVAIHRTYLKEPGRKADINPVKAMLGPVAGGAVRLSAGSGPLVVAEGIETALSLLDGLRGLDLARVGGAQRRRHRAGSTFPAPAGELVIAPDPGRDGMKAAKALADRALPPWLANVQIMKPPEQADWNDAAISAEAAT